MIALISDLDGTLLGDEYGRDVFHDFIKPLRQDFFLVYATGRDLAEFNSAVSHEGLMMPDAAVINTGADILMKGREGLVKNSAWHSKIGTKWHKDRIESALKRIEGISGQQKSNEYKLSYFVDALEAVNIREKAIKAIEAAGLSANIILSHGIYMDVLPEGCDKGESAAFLLSGAGISMSDAIVAGDSENDYDLFRRFSRGIVVGNALDGLKEKLQGRDFYYAGGHCGEGVVEGLKYYMNGMKNEK